MTDVFYLSMAAWKAADTNLSYSRCDTLYHTYIIFFAIISLKGFYIIRLIRHFRQIILMFVTQML